MTHEEKMEQAIKMANLPPAVMAAIGDPKTIVASLAISMGIIVAAGAAAAATGVGAIAEVAGAILLLGGAALAGYQIGTGITQLIDFYNKTRCDRAKTAADLKDASRDFASGVSNMGVGAFMLLLSAAGAKGKGAFGEELPDSETVARTGEPSTVNPSSNRTSEMPYRNPPEMYTVRPGNPLPELDPARTYLWAVDKDGNILVAPEDQEGWDRPVKHGDLVPGPGGQSRGAARTGGELNYNPDSGEWEMNNDSSYVFNRTDGQTGTGENLEAAHDLLTQSGTDTSNISPQNSHGSQ